MDKEKGFRGEGGGDSTSRARNRTVMLTPEITGQVRARLAQEAESPPPVVPTPPQGGGFDSPRGFGQRAPQPPPPPAYEEDDQFTSPGEEEVAPQPPRGVAAPPRRERATWVKETPVVGFLVSYDVNPNGDVYELRTGRMVVTSRAQAGTNCLVIEDESVSPMHAIVRIDAKGQVQVLDQLSEFGTTIVRLGTGAEEQLSGEKGFVEHGDILRFGSRSFHVCVVLRQIAPSEE